MINKLCQLWGTFRFLATYLNFYTSAFILFFSMVGAYDTLQAWLRTAMNWDLRIWQYFVVVGVLLTAGLIFERRITIPNVFLFWNKMWYDTPNEMKDDILRVEKKVNKIMNKFGIEDED